MSDTIEISRSDHNQINQPSKWGLIPDFTDEDGASFNKLIHHFFVEFNPLYLISALCVFYGVFLVANNLQFIDQAGTLSGQTVLFIVVQTYEAMIIGGIAFLVFKARTIRPAIILCLLECILIFDCTFRLESLSLLGNTGLALFGIWFVLVLVKSWLIAKIMKLNLNWIHYGTITAAALSLAIIVELLSQPWMDKTLLLQIAAWLGAFVLIGFIFRRPSVTSQLANNLKNNETAVNCIDAGFTIVALFYFYHVLAYLFFAADFSVKTSSIISQFSALTLMLTMLKPKAIDVLKWGTLTLLLGLTAPFGISYACFILAAVTLYRANHLHHTTNKLQDNYAIVSAALCYTGFWLIGWSGLNAPLPPMPELISLPSALLALSLLAIAIIFQNAVSLSLILMSACYLIFNYINSILPTNELDQGILVITGGFVAFISGLLINWKLRPAQA